MPAPASTVVYCFFTTIDLHARPHRFQVAAPCDPPNHPTGSCESISIRALVSKDRHSFSQSSRVTYSANYANSLDHDPERGVDISTLVLFSNKCKPLTHRELCESMHADA